MPSAFLEWAIFIVSKARKAHKYSWGEHFDPDPKLSRAVYEMCRTIGVYGWKVFIEEVTDRRRQEIERWK